MPLLLATWAGLLFGAALLVPGMGLPLAIAGLTLGALATAVVAGGAHVRRRLIFIPAVLALAAARGASTAPGPGPLDGMLGHPVTLVGTALRSTGRAGLQSFWVGHNSLDGRPLEGTVRVSARSPVPVVPGSTVRVSGTLERLPGRSLDGTTGYDERMQRQGVLAAMPAASYRVVAAPPTLSVIAMTWRAREALSAGVRARVPEPEASVLLGELVGIRSRLPPGVETALVDSGLVHLLAVSGLKVALVASILSLLLRAAGRRAALLAVVGIFAYALVGGGSAAALRSAAMGSLSLFAQALRRDPDPPRSLLLAGAPMLALNPALAVDLSFQYTFLGVAGIQFLEPPFSRRLRRLPRLLREAAAVSLAAQVATLPLTAAYFHVISLSAPLTNALAIPMLGPTMAVAAWVALGLPDPGGLAAATAAGSAHLLLGVAGVGGLGLLRVPWFAGMHAAAYLSALAVVLAAGLSGRRLGTLPRALQASLATPAAAVLVATMALLCLSRPDGRLHLVFMDTPGGGALITAPDQARLLVDAGTSPGRLAAALDGQLAPPLGSLDGLLLTASSPVAAGGVEGLRARLPPTYLAPRSSIGDVPRRVAAQLAARGVLPRWVEAGDRLDWHGLELDLGGCGSGLAVTVRFGASAAWICNAGETADPGVVPYGPLAAADLGPGVAAPEALPGDAFIVAHGSRSPRGVLNPATLGPRLWRTPRDGPLSLVCDQRSCRRS